MKCCALFCLCVFCGGPLSAQIFLNNPSFEGEPGDARVPVGWYPCQPMTTPDILPGVWGVYTEPSEGETFVGMITRENNTWESITQRLREALQSGSCYTFTLDLAHSETYNFYNQPIKLRIWGSSRMCGKDQLLLETDFIDHVDWQTYEARFIPKQPLHFLLLEAFFQEGYFAHRGNILIDNLSAIRKCTRAFLAPSETKENSGGPFAGYQNACPESSEGRR